MLIYNAEIFTMDSKGIIPKGYITFENGAKSPISIYKAKDLLYISPRTQKAIDKKIKQLITA